MVVTTVASPTSLDPIADQLFEFLWGNDRTAVPTAGDHAYRQIWCRLISGKRLPGERLSDVELASQLGVSRTPVRQALHRLAQEELVQFDPRRGFSVRIFTAQDVHEMYDVRAALEALALRQAVPRLRLSDIEQHLEQNRHLLVCLTDDPVVPCLRNDFELHNLLIHASGNGRLIRMLARLRSQVSVFQIRDASYPCRLEMALVGHQRVLVALLAGRTDEAVELLAEHIAEAKTAVLSDMFDERAAR